MVCAPPAVTSAPRNDSLDSMIFIMIGPTGTGKTSFINALAGTSGNGEAARLNADTRDISSHVVEHDSYRLVLVDTPGLDNIHTPNAEIFTRIARWLGVNAQPNIEVRIIYFHRITDNRIQGSPHENIEALRTQCKGVVVRQICLVTSMWDEVGEADTVEAEMRERFLGEEFWRKNVRVLFKRFNNQLSSSARDTIIELIRDEHTPYNHAMDNLTFIIIGPTGTGKTNFINVLTGTLGDGGAAHLNAGTRDVSSHVIEHDGYRLVFVDTPGLDNIHLPNAEIFARVVRRLEVNSKQHTKLGIIYFHRITDNRIQGPPHENVEMLFRQCGGVARQISLVTTMWDEVDDPAEAEMREGLLKEEFQNLRVRVFFERFDNKHSSAWNIINSLVRGEARRLQEDLENRQRRSNEPGTGRASYNQLQLLFLRKKEILQQLIGQAVVEGNVSCVHDLQVELDILDAQMQMTFEEMQERNFSITRRVLQWLGWMLDTTASIASFSITSFPEII